MLSCLLSDQTKTSESRLNSPPDVFRVSRRRDAAEPDEPKHGAPLSSTTNYAEDQLA